MNEGMTGSRSVLIQPIGKLPHMLGVKGGNVLFDFFELGHGSVTASFKLFSTPQQFVIIGLVSVIHRKASGVFNRVRCAWTLNCDCRNHGLPELVRQ
jgi:hypothetical protein